MKELMKLIVGKLPTYWKLATLRCSIYALLVGWGSFQAGVEGFASFDDMTRMQLLKLAGNIATSMAGVWLAFLDQTLSRLQKQTPPTAEPTKTEP